VAATPPATADVIARVAEVVDGRTVKVEITVRLRDIEIPNQNGACAYEQALAESVKREVQRVIGRKVALSRIEADAYGRLAARVVTRETGDLGAYLLAEGLAKETNHDPATWCE
jgi:endonuclease YncB( thermonuclease family)